MSDAIFINKSNPLTPAQDYEALRTKGFELIEQLGHELWTDYNNSDPGITILEAVVYAITDLAYRTGFEIKDLLAPENLTEDTWKNIFYTARNILHNCPLTVTDYRKLIIDTEGVRNAWLEPSKEYEVPVWVDYNYYEVRDEEDCKCPHPDKVFCQGKLGLQAADANNVQEFLKGKTDEVTKKITDAQQTINDLNTKIASVNAEIQKETDPVALEELRKSLDDLNRKLKWKNKNLADLNKEIEFIKKISFTRSKIVEFEGLYNVMVEYEENIIDDNQREEVRQKIVQKLFANRNLCEDFLSINAVEYEDFGLGTSISLEENADPDMVLAKIFFVIYKYFTPSVPFYTIDQMIAKGYSIDEIFEGPALDHGFIENSALEKTALFRDIRLSDIINELMDIEGIKAITYLHLPFSGFDSGNANVFFTEWVDNLRNERKIARIRPELSQVIFCKENDLVTYYTGSTKDRRPNRMVKLFSDLKTTERKYKLQQIPLDLPVPKGEFMELEDYYPVTDSLPMTYGVSDRAGLPTTADEKRKIQALQLEGYMLFFEQVLYDYLLQLSHLRDLYTMDNTTEHTYYTGALTQLNYLKSLLIDTGNHGNDYDSILKDFSDFLQYITEPPEQFFKRRNIFLNHFLARFGEDLSDYESLTQLVNFGNPDKELVTAKTAILNYDEYKKISSARGEGYNYADPEFWDTQNISGAERRISRLLGFSEVTRRTLVPGFIVITPVMITDKKNQQVQKTDAQGNPLNIIKIVDPDNSDRVIITSVEVKDGCCTEQLITDILTSADIPGNIKLQDNPKARARKTAGAIGNYWFELYDGPDIQTAVLLAESDHFDNPDDRNKVLNSFQNTLDIINRNEGLHLIEHLLLRPRLDEVFDENNNEIPVSFLNICLQQCDLGIGLDEGDAPKFRKKISRIPSEKCYDKMPWVLEYLDQQDHSLLFQKVVVKDDFTTTQTPLKFRKYEGLSQRIAELDEFGSEISNYTIVSNNAEAPAVVKYGFLIQNDKGDVLAQSLFVYNKKTKAQELAGTPIQDDIEVAIKDFADYFGTEMDWYCQPNPCDNNEDPYSFRTTAVLPCWPKRLRDKTFKNLVEKTISSETPAHIHTRVVWLGLSEMKRFEEAYYSWLEELSVTEIPEYPKVNPLIDVLNSLQPCGTCKDDCKPAQPTNNEPAGSQPT